MKSRNRGTASVRAMIGVAGTSVTIGTSFTGFMAKALPVLQALSLTVSIAVGCVTLVWWVIRIRKGK